ncbi:MAG TPA: glycosyltransferase [Bacteroidota bacterium]|nr:glycosyltransferase [Bacteroidota bacterium]
MQFSVIIPTYNEEQFIVACLQSIIQQDVERSEYEIIVSDASSTDRTRDLAQPFADTIVVTAERGIALGRNRGARAAMGEIFVFVDADAKLHPSFLRTLKMQFATSNVVGVTGIARAYDGTMPQRFVYQATYMLVRFFLIFQLALFPGICVAYRKEAFFHVNGFREDFGVVEDLDLSRRISNIGKVVLDAQAKATVSSRRLSKHLIPTVGYHIYNDLRYLFTGTAARQYPKIEETHSWKDLWKQ